MLRSQVSLALQAFRRGLLVSSHAEGAATSSPLLQLGRRGLGQSAVEAGASVPQRQRGGSLLTDYKQLSKFKLSSLVVLTAGAGFVAGSGDSIDWKGLAWTSLGTFGAAACANTLNQLYEVANDRLMTRTCNRPLPTGRLTKGHAAGFALATGALGLGVLYYKTNWETTCLGATNILMYAAVYTPLKQFSIINTWVGAVVGAIPPLMGWAAASGQLDVGAAVLAGALFFWQMPHFMALAWLCKEDYIRGGFSMITKFDATGRRTALVAMRHCLYLAPIGLLAYMAEITTQPFAWEAAGMAAVLGAYAVRFAASPSQQSARKMFRASLLYLPLLMLGLVVHRLPNQHTVDAEVLCVKAQRMAEGLPWLVAGVRNIEILGSGMLGLGSGIKDSVLASSIKCPSKVHCDSEEEVEEQPAKGAKSGEEPPQQPKPQNKGA